MTSWMKNENEANNPDKTNTTVSLTSSANPSGYDAPTTFKATVDPPLATGTMTFMDGAATLGTETVSNGTARYSISSLPLGEHSITAVYSGDASHNPSTSPVLTQVVSDESGNPPSKLPVDKLTGKPHVPADPATNPAPSTAKVVITIQSTGDGRATLVASPVGDSPGNPLAPDGTSMPEWSSDNPALTVARATDDPSGLKAIASHGVPPEIVIGAVVSVSYRLAGNVTVEGKSALIDVVKGGHKEWKVVSRVKVSSD